MKDPMDNKTSEADDGGLIDEAMLEMGEFLSEMTDIDGYLVDTEMKTSMKLEQVNMSMPVQLDVHVSEGGSVILGGSPPLYYAETTFPPVFHQLRIKIEIEEKENTEEDGGSE